MTPEQKQQQLRDAVTKALGELYFNLLAAQAEFEAVRTEFEALRAELVEKSPSEEKPA